VVLDSSVPHLDREFDYLIPEELSEKIKIGSRVQVTFGRQKLFGWVVEISCFSEFTQKIAPIIKVVGAIENFDFLTLRLAKLTAAKYAGNTSDVLRFCSPPRHAATEKSYKRHVQLEYLNHEVDLNEISSGQALLNRVGLNTKAAVLLKSHDSWMRVACELIKSAINSKKNALIVVPENYLIVELANYLNQELKQVEITKFSADQEAAHRYENYLNILFQNTQIVIGTRNAIFTPLANNGLIVIYQEHSDLLTSPQAPYWSAGQVAQDRANLENSCLVYLGFSISSHLYFQAKHDEIKIINNLTDNYNSDKIEFDMNQTKIENSQFSSSAWQALNRSNEGPVLLIVHRRGEAGVLRCRQCFAIASCPECGGVLRILSRQTGPECSRCARICTDYKCSNCKNSTLKDSQAGQSAILQEIGRKFSKVKVISSNGEKRIFKIDETPAIVVSTPQAIPQAHGGYKSIIILHAESFFTRPILNINEEIFHQWMYFCSLLEDSNESRLIVNGELDPSFVSFFSTQKVIEFIENEIAARKPMNLPPHRFTIVVSGTRKEVEIFKENFAEDKAIDLMGPVSVYSKVDRYQIAILHNAPEVYLPKSRNLLKVLSTKGKSSLQIQVDPIDFI
jgi:primosomal protein N' (replication factor Y) (superfamily II helicase)